MKNKLNPLQRRLTLLGALMLSSTMGYAQTTAQPAPAAAKGDEEVYVLSPFEVSAESEAGYTAATTLAGNRLNTELRDIGNAVTVITSQFLKDIGATNNETLLQYTTGTEVGNIRGNYAGVGDGTVLNEADRFSRPNQNTRVRGLAAADNTRDYFLSDIPWDGYNVDRVDLQRGPNSILFGLGSPAGLLNVGTKQAGFRDSNEVQFRYDNWGSTRVVGNFNKVLIRNELAVRIDTVKEDAKFQQDPAYENNSRIFGAVRWEPGFLKKGSARTIVKANFENGNIESNRPRTLPPIDRITPWFYTGTYNGSYKANGTYRDSNGALQTVTKGQTRVFNNLNHESFNPFQLQDDNTTRVNHGQMRPSINGGPDTGRYNQYFNPWVGNFGQQFGGVNAFYNNGDTELPASYFVWESRTTRGISSTGAIDGGLARSFHRPAGIASYAQFAANAALPYWQSGLYKAKSLTDGTVFDFYNNLLDGPNKSEWNDWNAYDVSLAQTFMNDKFGFEANFHHEEFTRGQLALLSGDRQAIYIDINNVYSDGTPAGLNGEPFQDGTPNPNVGRPFISDSGQGGNNEYVSERDALRVTGFFTHDFNRTGTKNLLTRILGKHTLTALYSDDTQETDQRNWQRYAYLDNNYRTIQGLPSVKFTDGLQAVNRVIYLGPALTSATNAYIPNPGAIQNVTSGQLRLFDSTWNSSVNPAAPWENAYYPVGNSNRASFQSENPANYVGFRNIPFAVTDSEASAANRNLLTTSAQLTKSQVTSKAFVWQANFWDKSLIGTYGYREDTAKAYGKSITADGTAVPGHLDLTPAGYSMPATPSNTIYAISRSYSIVAHMNQLPFIGKFVDRLPVEVTFFYNSSSNFQPAASRVDVYGLPLAPPSGKTIDRGILLETKDGRYSLKVNKYVTSLKDAASSAITNASFIGRSQAWGGNWANRFQYDWSGGDNSSFAVPVPDPTRTEYNYGADIGETLADAQAREARAIAGWRAWAASVDPRFYAAWKINLNDLTKSISASQPQGFTITEDSVSTGYEIEFNANPTRNWRLTLNASKTEAVRSNIGGTNLINFITAYQTALATTPAGDLRIWWGGAGNVTTLDRWYQDPDNQVGADWAQKRLAEGTKVAELRQWRFNAISNYDFTEGRLKGFNVGAGLRWQDKIAIGNRVVGDPYSTTLSIDLANPYYGPTEMSVDGWVGYKRRLPKKIFSRSIDWNIQLNVTNIGKGNSLIPITVQPDGTPAGYRIAPHQYWTLTNTFKF